MFLSFLYWKPVIPIWVGVGCAIAHFVFWYWLEGCGFGVPNFDVPGYFGPVAPFVALSAAVVWFLALRSSSSGAGESTMSGTEDAR
jgi:hypothetical protein